MKPVAWNGIHLQVPDDWELLQFSKNADKGRIVFGDRYQFRLEIDWATVDTPPSLDRMSDDYKAKLIQDGIQEPATIKHHPWHGVTGIEKDNRISRYCTYFNDRTFLIEAVFLWPEENTAKHDHHFETKLLDTIKIEPIQDDGLQTWKVYGMSILAPYAHRLDDCTAAPGKVKLTFCNNKETEYETVSRAGFLKVWMKNGIDDWLKTVVPKEYKIISLDHTSQEEHDIWTAEATIEKSVLKDWLKGRRRFTAVAWICPHDKRLYTITKQAHDYKDGTKPQPVSLSCCHQLEITL